MPADSAAASGTPAPRPCLGGAQLSLNWGYLAAIARGESAIDLQGMALRTREDAHRFAREYGLDPTNPRQRAAIARIHAEAVAFLAGQLLHPAEAAHIPEEVRCTDDATDLLVWASRYSRSLSTRRLWACAVLKVMHALVYIDSNLKLRHFDTIRRQVFAGLDQVLVADGERWLLGDGEIWLPLVHCEKKSNKGRHSILLKLLQKSAYVAEDIYDHLGVRFVLDTRFECLLALRVLQRAQILSAINIEAHRVRNTLLDLEAARALFRDYRAVLEASASYPHALLRQMDAELAALEARREPTHNPHSASSYRSVQITVRKRIHLAEEGAEDSGLGFYFNYEIQLLDRASFEATHSGPASHGAYKERQVATARRRVLGEELQRLLAAC
jgi:uncharacterized protein (TIGR04562 family)